VFADPLLIFFPPRAAAKAEVAGTRIARLFLFLSTYRWFR